MQERTHQASDQKELHLYQWNVENPRARLLIVHGMAEHAARYDRFAHYLNQYGIDVWAHDQRGHGKSISEGEPQGYIKGKDAWDRMSADISELLLEINSKDIPVYLMGHSFGSILTLSHVEEHTPHLQGVILSALPEYQPVLLGAGRVVSKIQMAFKGDSHPSLLMNSASFGMYNRPFKPCRTDFDWLSRDDEEVDKYIYDPLCGNVFPVKFFSDMFEGLKSAFQKNNLKKINSKLPVFLIAGTADAVVGGEKGFRKTLKDLRPYCPNLEYKMYDHGRHELLNDTVRDEVHRDILSFIESNLRK